ncbi:MAG TPA: hypothetical protein EYQ31_06100 [Candidatus Handelsmanbacteria bacterium]|nr:hypothetical protein [Candidatus Handelsmanbacteria bacterium]
MQAQTPIPRLVFLLVHHDLPIRCTHGGDDALVGPHHDPFDNRLSADWQILGLFLFSGFQTTPAECKTGINPHAPARTKKGDGL